MRKMFIAIMVIMAMSTTTACGCTMSKVSTHNPKTMEVTSEYTYIATPVGNFGF